jgi:hypothetical protein
MSLLKKNEEEKRREFVGGGFMMGCFFTFAAYSVYTHEPQWPLKAIAFAVAALIFFGMCIYNMRKKPSDPETLPGQITEIENKVLLSRWPTTLVTLFLTWGCLYALIAHRPQEATMAGIVALAGGVGAIRAWQIWLKRPR